MHTICHIDLDGRNRLQPNKEITFQRQKPDNVINASILMLIPIIPFTHMAREEIYFVYFLPGQHNANNEVSMISNAFDMQTYPKDTSLAPLVVVIGHCLGVRCCPELGRASDLSLTSIRNK